MPCGTIGKPAQPDPGAVPVWRNRIAWFMIDDTTREKPRANSGDDMNSCDPSLRATAIIDADHPAVRQFAADAVGDARDTRQKAIRLYSAVRDGFRYDPYKVDLSVAGMRASRVVENGHGWCIPKAVLLAAACRAIGIPARIGLADVRNHMSTQRLLDALGTDIFYRHGYTSILLEGRWVKATPAFNVELCRKMNLAPLEFDGLSDSVFHAFSADGSRHMEYLTMHGEFDDLPRDDILAAFERHYPQLSTLDQADWDRDVASGN